MWLFPCGKTDQINYSLRRINTVNRIGAMAVNKRPLFGVFFKGAYLPQKTDLVHPLERECNSVQKHVSSY
jgi:hypothetical protein